MKAHQIWLLIGLGTALLLAAFLAPFASPSPDGLERVAEDKGFLERAEAPGARAWNHSPMADYAMPGVAHEGLATSLAGVVGTIGVFLLALGLGLALRRPKDAAQ